MSIHDLIGYLLVVMLLLIVILLLIISIDMFFGQPLYIKIRRKYIELVERM